MMAYKNGSHVPVRGRVRNMLHSIRNMHFSLGMSSRSLCVPYSSLDMIRDGESVSISDGVIVEFRKMVSGLLFITSMSPGSILGDHYHPDAVEMVYVVSGSIIEKVSNTSYKTGDSFFIPPGVDHRIFAKEESRLNVQFVKQPKK